MTYATITLPFFRFRDIHLLNFDRDLCHKVYNSVKVFCKSLNKYLEDLWKDIHNDLKFSAAIKTTLKDFCLLLGFHRNKPSDPVAHWRLSVYITTAANLPMYNALLVCITLG